MENKGNEGKMITDWLEKYGDPKIERKVNESLDNTSNDNLITNDYIIHYGLDKYDDGNNLCFSIEFLNFKYKDGHNQQTYWFNDNHEFGDEDRSRECSIKIANWYLEDSWRIEMINSGWDNPKYKEYCELKGNFYKTLYEK